MKTSLVFFFAVSFLVSACGQLCVGGFIGNCTPPPQPPDNQVGETLTITPSLSGVYTKRVKIGQVLSLKVVGGKLPYYGRKVDPASCGSMDQFATVFTPLVPGDCTITVVDSTPKTKSGSETITVLPAN